MSQFNYVGESTSGPYKDEWITPDWVFDPLNTVFNFSLDAAADEYNTKVLPRYFSAAHDGLIQSWENETVFNNPPFTKGKYGDWVNKACLEFLNNSVETAQVLPFNPETERFSGVWETAHYLILPKKRIAFEYPELHPKHGETSSAKFYSVVALYTYRNLDEIEISLLLEIGRILDLWTGLHSK